MYGNPLQVPGKIVPHEVKNKAWEHVRCINAYTICALMQSILARHEMKDLTDADSVTRGNYCCLIKLI